jgi:hypothetical protein
VIGRNVTGVQGDVSNLDDLDRLFSRIHHQFMSIDVCQKPQIAAFVLTYGANRPWPFGPLSRPSCSKGNCPTISHVF